MKRFLALLTAIAFLIVLAGCAFPTGKDIETTDESKADIETESTAVKDKSGNENSAGLKDGTHGDADIKENIMLTPVTLYYQDSDGYLIPMTRWVEKQAGIARAAVYGLTDSSIIREELQYYGVYPVLPAGTEVIGINIKDGIAIVDFNSKLLEYENEDIERRIVSSLVYTLTEFSTISSVRLKVNGRELDTLKYGMDVSGLRSRSNIPINSKLAKGEKKAEVYYFKKSNEGFTYILPVSFRVGENEEVTPSLLIRQLLSKQPDSKLVSEMPEGAELISCTGNNGIMVMDFDEKLLEYEEGTGGEGMLKQLVYTARQSTGINKVKITVNQEAVKLPEGTDISSRISVPKTINDIIDR